jgi:large subunit ribosomal protein L29
MKMAELKGKDRKALEADLLGLRQEQFKLRMMQASKEMTKTHRIKQCRRAIARIKMLITQMTEKEHG